MRAAFPVYYKLLAVLSAIASVLVWYRVESVALAAVCAIFVFAWLVMLPRVDRVRMAKSTGDPAATRTFARLHRLSVVLNLVQLVVLLVVFLRLAR